MTNKTSTYFALAALPLLLGAARAPVLEDVKTVALSDTQIVPVPISMRGTVLTFPTKPSKVILGNTGSFGIEYVENDLAISPLRPESRSNLFVYVQGRRFSFDLRASPSGNSIVVVKDAVVESTRSAPNEKK